MNKDFTVWTVYYLCPDSSAYQWMLKEYSLLKRLPCLFGLNICYCLTQPLDRYGNKFYQAFAGKRYKRPVRKKQQNWIFSLLTILLFWITKHDLYRKSLHVSGVLTISVDERWAKMFTNGYIVFRYSDVINFGRNWNSCLNWYIII